MDFDWTMVEHLRIMGAIIHDLKVVGEEIFEGEQVPNMIWTLSDNPEPKDSVLPMWLLLPRDIDSKATRIVEVGKL